MSYHALGAGPTKTYHIEAGLMTTDAGVPLRDIVNDATSEFFATPAFARMASGLAKESDFKSVTGSPGVYGVLATAWVPLPDQPGQRALVNVPLTLSFPISDISKDIVESAPMQAKLSTTTTIGGAALLSVVMLTAGMTLLGTWLMFRKAR